MLKTIVTALKPLADRLGVPADKLAHAIAGFVIGFTGGAAVPHPVLGGVVGTLAAHLAGKAKERYDESHNGTVDLRDAKVTSLGGVAGAATGAAVRVFFGA